MNYRQAMIISLMALVILPSYGISGPISSSLSANATVICPFTVTAKPSHANYTYLKPQGINITYTVGTTVDCSIASMQGYLNLSTEGNTAVFKSYPLNITSVSNTAKLSSFPLNSSALPTGRINVNVSFSTFHFYNYSDTYFELLSPANMLIANFSATSVSTGSPEQFTLGLSNKANFSAENVFIHINVTGPHNFSLEYAIGNFTPYPTSKVYQFVAANLTSLQGSYKASAYLSYESSGKNYTSPYFNISYSVSAPPSHHVAPPKIHIIPQIPNVDIISMPLYIGLVPNATYTELIGVKNSGNATEVLNISLPSYFSSLFLLSASSISLLPGQSAYIEVSPTLSALKSPGIYDVPVNLSASINNKTVSKSQIVSYIIYSNSSKPDIGYSVISTNNTRNATATVSIRNPSNKSVSGMVAHTFIPSLLVSNASDVLAFGLPSSITYSNGEYEITWQLPSMPPHGTIYGYIRLINLSNPYLLYNIQNSLLSPVYTQPNLLSIISYSAPALEVNQSGNITINLLYTGPTITNISTLLTGPPMLNITGPSNNKKAGLPFYTATIYPGELLRDNFTVKSSKSGTITTTFFASIPGENASSNIQLLVIPIPSTPPAPKLNGIAAIQSLIHGALASYPFLLYLIPLIIILLLLTYAYLFYRTRPKYRKGREIALRTLQEKIKV